MGSNFSHNSLLIFILSILTSHQAKCHKIENEKDWSFQIKNWQYLKKHFLYLLLSTSSINFSLPACPFVLFLIKKIFWITGQGYHHPHPKSCHQCNRVSGLSHLKQDIPSLTADFAPIRNCGPGNKKIEIFNLAKCQHKQKKLKSIWPQDVIGGYSWRNIKQDHQWWRYHRRLLVYQSPYF